MKPDDKITVIVLDDVQVELVRIHMPEGTSKPGVMRCRVSEWRAFERMLGINPEFHLLRRTGMRTSMSMQAKAFDFWDALRRAMQVTQ